MAKARIKSTVKGINSVNKMLCCFMIFPIRFLLIIHL